MSSTTLNQDSLSGISKISKYKMLLCRELWEHKGALIWTPTIVAGLFILLSLLAIFSAAHQLPDDWRSQLSANEFQIKDVKMSADQFVQKIAEIPMADRSQFMKATLYVLRAPFDLLMLFLLPFYCIASLYDERKDRSIAFWRSLPVADWETVAAKALTAMLVFPAIILAAVAVFQLVWLVLATAACWYLGLPAWDLIWAPSQLPLVWAGQYLDYVLMMLWALPFIGVLMLAAVATRRPFVWAVLPFPLLWLTEFWLFDSTHLMGWFGERIKGCFAILYDPLAQIGSHLGDSELAGHTMGGVVSIVSNGQLWIGIALGLALLYGAVFMRGRAAEL